MLINTCKKPNGYNLKASSLRLILKEKAKVPILTGQATYTLQKMSQGKLPIALTVTLLLSFQLLLFTTPSAGARAEEREQREVGKRGASAEERTGEWEERKREARAEWQVQRAQGEKQMGFPYFMMMSGGNVAVPSLWLIPVVVASCIMLFIRIIMD